MLLAIDSPASGGVTLTQVHARFFHVDFAIPANSTLGVGPNHTPNAEITVNGFIDAFTSAAGFDVVPQQGTSAKLQSLGDKIMTPMVYQNRSGTESLWASGTVCTDANCTGATGIRWYQFNVTGGVFPATAVQQQTWTNGGDGIWRFMPSIAVDNCGDAAIGYSTSSTSMFPGIRYAGRLVTDPLNNLGQGEAVMFNGTASQTSDRWGDYSMTTVDPVDGLTFWHANEYQSVLGSFNWHTRIGSFKFGTCGGGGENIVLTGSALTRGTKSRVTLTWTPAENDGNIDIMRDGVVIKTVADNGTTTDKLRNASGQTHAYQVCETDGGGCSNTVNVVIP
jgi:hypothetical protein